MKFSRYSNFMKDKKPRSEVVHLVMPGSTEAEIEEATWRWFNFIHLLDRVVCRLEQEERDSRELHSNDRFEETPIKL